MGTQQHFDTPRYADSSFVAKGDRVFIPSEQVQARVSELILSQQQQREWGVSEPGVMFECMEFGLLFIPSQLLKEQHLERA